MFKQKRSHWWALAALSPAQIMIFMDQTILPVALPTIQRELHVSSLSLEWSVNIYLLFTTIFAIAGGKLGDRIGHRFTFQLGLLIFTLSSVLCGVSQNIEMLISARALQGVGAALMIPALSALFASVFPSHQRGRGLGLSVSIASFSTILGPFVGGYLTEAISWRWIFWINWPIALIGFCSSLFFLSPSIPKKGKIDFLALGYFAIFAASLTIVFMDGRDWSWLSLKTCGIVSLAVISFVFLIKREKKSLHPFLDLSLFKNSLFSAVNISIFLTNFILMISIFRAIYYQTVLGYSPYMAGFITFISSLPVMFFSSLGGFLSDRFGSRLPVAIGYCLLIFSFVWLGFSPTPSLSSLFVALFAFSMGAPLIFTPSYSAAMKALPAHKLGVGFGMIATLRTLAGTFGIALIGFCMHTVEMYRWRKDSSLPDARYLAEVASFSVIHFVLAGVMIIAFALTFIFYHRKSGHCLPEFPAEGWD